MIPKIIHYCWFGGAEKPTLIKHCIKSWKKRLPDYKIKEWNESNFDTNMAPFCQEAYAAKKYAFVADFCRVYALATEGGIYMDTDIIVLNSFDKFLDYSFCSCQEYQPWIFDDNRDKYLDENGKRLTGVTDFIPGMGIQSGVMMSEKGSPFILDCLQYYKSIHFEQQQWNNIVANGVLDNQLLEKVMFTNHMTRVQNMGLNAVIDNDFEIDDDLECKFVRLALILQKLGKGV